MNLANVIEKALMRPQMVVNPARGLAGTICEVYIYLYIFFGELRELCDLESLGTPSSSLTMLGTLHPALSFLNCIVPDDDCI